MNLIEKVTQITRETQAEVFNTTVTKIRDQLYYHAQNGNNIYWFRTDEDWLKDNLVKYFYSKGFQVGCTTKYVWIKWPAYEIGEQ